MNVLLSRLQPVFEQVRARIEHLPQKDQRALMVLSVFLGVVMIWLLLWRPLDSWVDYQHQQLVLERETQAFLAANYERAKALVKAQSSGPKKDAAAVIASSGRKIGLELARVQPARQGVSVWIDAAPYQKLLEWLVQLHNRENLEVRQIRVERTESQGVVKVFLRLAR